MTLAAKLRLLPLEIERMGLHDAVTLLQTMTHQEQAQLKFEAALHGCKLT